MERRSGGEDEREKKGQREETRSQTSTGELSGDLPREMHPSLKLPAPSPRCKSDEEFHFRPRKRSLKSHTPNDRGLPRSNVSLIECAEPFTCDPSPFSFWQGLRFSNEITEEETRRNVARLAIFSLAPRRNGSAFVALIRVTKWGRTVWRLLSYKCRVVGRGNRAKRNESNLLPNVSALREKYWRSGEYIYSVDTENIFTWADISFRSEKVYIFLKSLGKTSAVTPIVYST